MENNLLNKAKQAASNLVGAPEPSHATILGGGGAQLANGNIHSRFRKSDVESGVDDPPSLWLYVAGLVVTLSGLYAVNFGLEDGGFALLTYALAIIGYVVSYILRERKVFSRGLPLPILVGIVLTITALALSDQGIGFLAPSGAGDDRSKSFQLVFLWMAIIQSFLLSSNGAVLLACVPCLTMIALVSTQNSDRQLTNAFLVFVAGATFLMVHENFLRTRAGQRSIRLTLTNRLFGGQVLLAGICVILSFFLANLVAVPIQSVGQAFFIPGTIASLNTTNKLGKNADTQNVMVTEAPKVELAQGPQTETNQVLLHVECERGLYWRGATFDFYNGHSFQNSLSETVPIPPRDADDDPAQRARNAMDFNSGSTLPVYGSRFDIPDAALKMGASEAQDSAEVVQNIRVEGGVHFQIYGADRIREVDILEKNLKYSDSGTLQVSTPLAIGAMYRVRSRVPDESPERLRLAPSDVATLPNEIARLYLQTATETGDDQALSLLVSTLIKGIKNNYDKVEALKAYIARTCKYNLQSPKAPNDVDVVRYFLETSHQGYCDSFGAALTVLCRYAQIPARLCSGFLTGELGSDGAYIVRQKHKHIWTEVYFPNVGWVKFDSTEGAEDISDHSDVLPKKPNSFLAWLKSQGQVPTLVAIVVVGLFAFVLKTEISRRLKKPSQAAPARATRRSDRNAEIVACYLRAGGMLARRGLPRAPNATPDEYLRQVEAATRAGAPDIADAWQTLTGLCRRFAYSSELASSGDVSQAQQALASLRVLLRRSGPLLQVQNELPRI